MGFRLEWKNLISLNKISKFLYCCYIKIPDEKYESFEISSDRIQINL